MVVVFIHLCDTHPTYRKKKYVLDRRVKLTESWKEIYIHKRRNFFVELGDLKYLLVFFFFRFFSLLEHLLSVVCVSMCICLPILIFRSCNLVRVEVCVEWEMIWRCVGQSNILLYNCLFVCFLTNLAKFQKKVFVVLSPPLFSSPAYPF